MDVRERRSLDATMPLFVLAQVENTQEDVLCSVCTRECELTRLSFGRVSAVCLKTSVNEWPGKQTFFFSTNKIVLVKLRDNGYQSLDVSVRSIERGKNTVLHNFMFKKAPTGLEEISHFRLVGYFNKHVSGDHHVNSYWNLSVSVSFLVN